MAEQLRFIHAADLHIGAPFRGLRQLSPAWSDRLMDAIPEAYERLVDAAVERQVDFVVLAGDIFDTTRASYGDYLRFFRGLDRLSDAGIATYLCTGNHDPLTSWQQDFFALPESAHMLSADHPDFLLHRRDGRPLCIVAGRGYPHKVWSPDEDIAAGITRQAAVEALGPEAAAAPFGVAVLHTGLSFDPNKAPTDVAELQRAGFDYWALGHIHKRYVDDEANPRVAFSGCVQGRDINETGARGVSLVTLAEGAANTVEFIPTASVAWEKLTVDVTDCATIAAIGDKVMRAQFDANGKASCEEMISRVTLRGATPLHEALGAPGVLDDLRASLNGAYADFFVDAIVDGTTMPIDKEALRAEGLFPAVLMQAADAQRACPAEQELVVQDAFMKAKLSPPSLSAEALDGLMAEAEDLVLDLLAREA